VNCRPDSAAATVARRGVPEARIEWRPSRWLLAAILLLGMLGACAILASEMPRLLAWPFAVGALGCGGWRFLRERRQAVRSFVLRGDAATVLVDGAQVHGFELEWRGPLAFASWRDGQGRRQRCAWWPDTLPPPLRRELRLAAPGGQAARSRANMRP